MHRCHFPDRHRFLFHHQKHHQAYVNGANAIMEKLDSARQANAEIDIKAALKELSFNIGGYFQSLTIIRACHQSRKKSSR